LERCFFTAIERHLKNRQRKSVASMGMCVDSLQGELHFNLSWVLGKMLSSRNLLTPGGL
jgi:hypothetical protein